MNRFRGAGLSSARERASEELQAINVIVGQFNGGSKMKRLVAITAAFALISAPAFAQMTGAPVRYC